MRATAYRRLFMLYLCGLFMCAVVVGQVLWDGHQHRPLYNLPGAARLQATSANGGGPELEKSKVNPTQVTNITNNTTNSTNTTTSPSEQGCDYGKFSKFPPDLFSRRTRLRGAILLHLAVACYMFAALALVCDYYFVPSLQVISAKLKIQSDVAGASLLAIGGSAPELFISIIGVMISKSDIGLGTILGSAVFNVVFVIGICGVVAGTALRLSWWPVSRDCCCYGFSIVVLTLILYDDKISWKEALVLVCLYPCYLVLMYFNPRLEYKVYKYIGDKEALKQRFPSQNNSPEASLMKPSDDDEEGTTYETAAESSHVDGSDECLSDMEESADSYEFELDEVENFWQPPDAILPRICWFIQLPIYAAFFFTIPDIRREGCKKFVLLTFIVSILWIGVLTYILLWMVDTIGDTLNVPDSIMGLTFVAFGGSVPDTISSIIVAREGYGDMAVSHSLGSNVFDILLCLGLPWLFYTLLYDYNSIIEVKSQTLLVSCFVLFVLLILCYVLIYWKKFVLDKRLGYTMLGFYAVFLVVSVSFELVRILVYHQC